MEKYINFPGKKNYSIASGNYAFGFMPEMSVAMVRATKKEISIFGLEEAEVMSQIAQTPGGNPEIDGPEAEKRYIGACLKAGHLISSVPVEDTAAVAKLVTNFGMLSPLPGEGSLPLLSSLMLAFDLTTSAIKPRVIEITEIRKKFVIVDTSESDQDAESIAQKAFFAGEISMDDAESSFFTLPYPMLFGKEEQNKIQHI